MDSVYHLGMAGESQLLFSENAMMHVPPTFLNDLPPKEQASIFIYDDGSLKSSSGEENSCSSPELDSDDSDNPELVTKKMLETARRSERSINELLRRFKTSSYKDFYYGKYKKCEISYYTLLIDVHIDTCKCIYCHGVYTSDEEIDFSIEREETGTLLFNLYKTYKDSFRKGMPVSCTRYSFIIKIVSDVEEFVVKNMPQVKPQIIMRRGVSICSIQPQLLVRELLERSTYNFLDQRLSFINVETDDSYGEGKIIKFETDSLIYNIRCSFHYEEAQCSCLDCYDTFGADIEEIEADLSNVDTWALIKAITYPKIECKNLSCSVDHNFVYNLNIDVEIKM